MSQNNKRFVYHKTFALHCCLPLMTSMTSPSERCICAYAAWVAACVSWRDL